VPENKDENSIAMRVAQGLIIGIGLMGAVAHASLDENFGPRLELDAITIAWVAVAIIGFLLPDISEVGYGDFKVNLKKAREGAADISQTLADAANLAQNWSTSIAIFLTMMQQDQEDLPEPKQRLFEKYLRDRMGEAKTFLGDEPGEQVRIALWLYRSDVKIIRFAGISIGGAAPTKLEYKIGEGMIGQAFEESFYETRNFNEADVRSVPSYSNTRGGTDPPYKAVLCQAVRWANQPIGVITVDKPSASYFSPIAQDIAKGLASQCAIAITQYTRFAQPATSGTGTN
jgi:GAF domain-containing protein